MTDKQIIVDGVDVSECEDYGYRWKARYWCHNCDEPCTDYPNCYYKQLKRKEQSEVKLVGQIQTICDFINNRPETFKGIYGGVDKIITEYAELKAENDKLKQTLTEIKEIVEKQVKRAPDGETFARPEIKQILQK